MPRCLHLLDAYLHGTETFIWQYLRRAQRFLPLVLADAWENADQFPLPRGEFLRLQPERSGLARLQARLRGAYAPVQYSGGAEILHRRDLALCHAHNGYRACITADFVATLDKPLVVSFYGADVSRADVLRRAAAGYRRLFGQARALLVEGPAMRRRLLDLGAPEDKIRLCRIAVDPADYRLRARAWDGRRDIRLLFIGRLVEKKGLDVGLKALADARIDFPWRLSVVGDGPLRKGLEALAQKLRLRDRVDFLGYRPWKELRDLLDTHDLLFQPSRRAQNGDSEGGAPTVILEAQAGGMPVVSTRHDDIPFVTVSDHSAWLAPAGDASALAETLRRAAQEHGRWGEMGRAGRAKVEADHNSAQEIEVLERIYAEVSG